jgi:hypothetical protein
MILWCFVISWHIGLQVLRVFHPDRMVNNSLDWCSLKMFGACVSLQGKINHFKEIGMKDVLYISYFFKPP